MAPPKPLACIKNHVEGKWLSEVYNGDLWSPYPDWAAQYEPKKEKKQDAEWKKKHKQKVANKAKETVLGKLQNGMTTKMTLMVLEMVARVLNLVEDKLSTAAATASSSTSTAAATSSLPLPGAGITLDIAKLVNHVSGVVLAYRFSAHSKKHMNTQKAKYFKTASVQQLALCVQVMLHDQVTGKLSDVQKELQRQFNMADQVRSLAEEKLNEFLNVQNLEQKTDEIVDKAVAKVQQDILTKIADTAGAATAAGSPTPEELLKAAGLEPPKLPASALADTVESVEAKVKQQKNEMVHLLTDTIRQNILEKMETVADWISFYMDQLLAFVTLAATTMTSTTAAAKAKQVEKSAAALMALIESIYEQLETTVEQEVSNVIGLIGTMTEKPADEKEEDEAD